MKRYPLPLLLLLLLASLFVCSCSTGKQASTNEPVVINDPAPPYDYVYKVARVVDGDTIQVDYSGKPEKVRYIGVDTPETVHPSKPVQFCGKEASERNKQLVAGKKVALVTDVEQRDRYGRLLAYVYVRGSTGGDIFVNAQLVKEGLAVVSTYPPNVAHVDDYTALQKEARDAGRGVWGDSDCAAVGGAGAPEKKAAPAAQGDCAYVGSIKSGKYHYPDCRHAESIKPENRRCFASEDEAQAAGYVPCKVCSP